MLLGVVGRATLASFGSPFFWLDRLVPRLLRGNEYFEIAGRLIRIRGNGFMKCPLEGPGHWSQLSQNG